MVNESLWHGRKTLAHTRTHKPNERSKENEREKNYASSNKNKQHRNTKRERKKDEQRSVKPSSSSWLWSTVALHDDGGGTHTLAEFTVFFCYCCSCVCCCCCCCCSYSIAICSHHSALFAAAIVCSTVYWCSVALELVLMNDYNIATQSHQSIQLIRLHQAKWMRFLFDSLFSFQTIFSRSFTLNKRHV